MQLEVFGTFLAISSLGFGICLEFRVWDLEFEFLYRDSTHENRKHYTQNIFFTPAPSSGPFSSFVNRVAAGRLDPACTAANSAVSCHPRMRGAILSAGTFAMECEDALQFLPSRRDSSN